MLRTLIVEDDFVGRKILQALLAPYGICDLAANGEEAIEAFASSLGAGKPYRLICLDITMPGMDGHQVLERIRSMEESMNIKGLDRVRVIMTTASHDRKDIREAFESECDAYLVKPIEPEKLQKSLSILGLL